ncbi:MAG TPA: ribosomal RNA small subunit methyltransferase A [Synergistetes bacterium]|nr:ribosomal RNA small subunit methyltransferase A [Synergistota bacterium]
MGEVFHRANTRIGQNFLIDKNILQIILKHADISPDDSVLEVGAGKGILTRAILEKKPLVLYSLEIDRSLEPFLGELSDTFDNFKLFWGDALREGFPSSFDPCPNKIVANIPYHITTPLIWKVLEELAEKGLNYFLLMVQKEAAERICAPARCKERYPLGITLQSMGKPRILRLVTPESFRPAPSVTSALLEIRLSTKTHLPNCPLWRRLLRSGFAQRRKTLVNNLGRDFPELKKEIATMVTTLGYPATARAEELEVETWLDLLEVFAKRVDK